MTTVIAVVAALLAAFCFAVAALVQQTVARATGADEAMHPRLLLDLARRPRWLAGIGLDALSFLILALALAFGPLALVQPLASLDVLFALPLIARLQGRRLTLGDGIGAVTVAGGIVIFLAVAPPTGGIKAPGLTAWAPVFVAAGALSAVTALAGLRVTGKARVIWLALAAGSVYGVLAALTKATVDVVAVRGVGVLRPGSRGRCCCAGSSARCSGRAPTAPGRCPSACRCWTSWRRSSRWSSRPRCSTRSSPLPPGSSACNWLAARSRWPASPCSAARRSWPPRPRAAGTARWPGWVPRR